MIIRKEINIDIERETELMMAKLQPYDGKTVYSKEENKEFMGYELRPYERRVEIRKIENGLEVTFEVGTQVVKHNRVTSVYMEMTSIPIPQSRQQTHEHIPNEGPIPGSFMYYIDGTYCDEKIYNEKLEERRQEKEDREERLGLNRDRENYRIF